MIYKLFTGRYIDISKLVSVSEITEDKRLDEKHFTLTFQLLEKPIIIKMRGTMIFREQPCGSWIFNYDDKNEINAEEGRDKILNDWQAFKNNLNLEI
jgi:hypothetical protein